MNSDFGNWDDTDDEDWGGEEGRYTENDGGEIYHRIIEMYDEDGSRERKRKGHAATEGGGLTAK